MFLSQKLLKIAQVSTALMVAVTLTACFSSSSSSNDDDDDDTDNVVATLAVTSVSPADEATGTGTNVKVLALFNQSVKSETLTENSFKLQGENESAISGSVSYNAETKTAAFKPGSLLSNNTTYTATITTAVENASDESLLEDLVWSFTTAEGLDETAPTVESSAPEDGDTNVLLNTKVTVVFSKAIDPVTITADSFKLTNDSDDSAVSGSRLYVNPTTVVLTPENNLAEDADFTLTLNTDIKDLADNSLALTTVSFETGSTTSSSPDAVNLGTAGNYVILAKTGISTTGTTTIVGDIAVSPESRTAITGFSETLSSDGTVATSPLVTGNLYSADMTSPTSSNLTTAVSDMETAFTDAAGRADPDFTELGAGEIGGMTLDPGLYKWGTGVLVTSDVTLKGGADDVWIFQIEKDLKLEDGKAIILTGGALPKNIFWQVAGEVTLQAGTTFNGIILTKTAVEAKSGAVINGRALAQTAVTLISNEVTEPAD